MKKIVILALHLGVGGIEKYISTLSSFLEEKYEVEIISTFKVYDKPAFEFSPNVKIKYLIDGREDDVSLKKMLKSGRLIKSFKEIVKRIKFKYLKKSLNKKIIKELDCDYLITTRTFHNEVVSKYLNNDKIVTIATEHNYHQNDEKYITNLVKSLRKFDYLVVSTDELCSFYSSRLQNTKCVKIGNALDNISKVKTKFENKNFISVGRFSSEKGFLDLIDVFSIIHSKDSSVKLFLLGDGYQKEVIEEKIKAMELEKFIILPGYVVSEEQMKYYLNSSVYLMTSFTECFGLVLIEAMNYGVPCIAFDCASGARYLLNEEIGILIENRNKELMADRALTLINDKKKLKEYQDEINNYIKKFSKKSISDEWFKLLENALK